MPIQLPPPPNQAQQNTRVWKDWFTKLQATLAGTAGISWDLVDKAGSALSDIVTRPHSVLQNIQGTGGYHLSSAEQAAVTSGIYPDGLRSSGPSTGIGYVIGAGGIVVQATSKTTSVTLNTVCGAVVMNNAALAAGAVVTFTMDNTTAQSNDVIVTSYSGGTAGAYVVNAVSNGGLSHIVFSVTNISSGSLSEAITIHFATIRAAQS